MTLFDVKLLSKLVQCVCFLAVTDSVLVYKLTHLFDVVQGVAVYRAAGFMEGFLDQIPVVFFRVPLGIHVQTAVFICLVLLFLGHGIRVAVLVLVVVLLINKADILRFLDFRDLPVFYNVNRDLLGCLFSLSARSHAVLDMKSDFPVSGLLEVFELVRS